MPEFPLNIALVDCLAQPLPSTDINANSLLQYNNKLSYTSFSVDEEFRDAFCKHKYDAVLFACQSVSEPGLLAILNWIRYIRGSNVPVMILADQRDESGVAKTLYAGADDVQAKSIIPNVLSARILALCHRAAGGNCDSTPQQE